MQGLEQRRNLTCRDRGKEGAAGRDVVLGDQEHNLGAGTRQIHGGSFLDKQRGK